jgi:hypothetical protein
MWLSRKPHNRFDECLEVIEIVRKVGEVQGSIRIDPVHQYLHFLESLGHPG